MDHVNFALPLQEFEPGEDMYPERHYYAMVDAKYVKHGSIIDNPDLNALPKNIINAGISGDTAEHGAKRLERDVLRHDPDLVILSFGKNDIWGGDEGLLKYISATKEIIRAVKERGIEIVYLTCSMLNTDVSPHITDEGIRELAEKTAKIQQDGTMDKYQNAVMELCRQEGVPVCDLYGDWKLMQKNGVNITELLANKINHPIRELNWLAAMSLVKTIMEN